MELEVYVAYLSLWYDSMRHVWVCKMI